MSKFLEGIAALFNKPQTELSQLYSGENNDTLDEEKALAAIKEWLTAKVKDVQKNQHARGIIETAKAWETGLAQIAKDRKIELPEDVKGVEALNTLVDALTSVDPKSKDGDLPVDDIRKLKNFQAAIDQTIAPIKQKLVETEKSLEVERFENSVKYNRDKVIQMAFETLEAEKWKSGESEAEKRLRRETIVERLDYKTRGFTRVKIEKVNGQETPILLDDNGNPLKDELQNTVQFEKWVSGSINSFGVHVFDKSKGSAGASNNGKPNDGGDYVVQSGVALEDALNGVNDGGERSKIIYAYAKSMETPA